MILWSGVPGGPCGVEPSFRAGAVPGPLTLAGRDEPTLTGPAGVPTQQLELHAREAEVE